MAPGAAGRSERGLVLLLRLSFVLMLPALAAAALPRAWLATAHARLGIGEFPAGAITEYLARSVSLLYFAWGLLFLYCSLDVRRYLALLRFTAVCGAPFAAGMLLIDLAADMPWAWTAGEAAFILGYSAVMFWLVRRAERTLPA